MVRLLIEDSSKVLPLLLRVTFELGLGMGLPLSTNWRLSGGRLNVPSKMSRQKVRVSHPVVGFGVSHSKAARCELQVLAVHR
jgi:hypothetical protein